MNTIQINNARRSNTSEKQYAGHRFLLTRSNRRHMPPSADYYDDDDDDNSTLPDTSFVQSLIDSTDKKFVDSLLVGSKKNGGYTTYDDSNDPDSGGSSNRPTKRWWLPKKCGHIILGMFLMYLLLTLWERRQTKTWWDSYVNQLDTTMYEQTNNGIPLSSSSSYLRKQYNQDLIKDPSKLYDPLSSTTGMMLSMPKTSNTGGQEPTAKNSLYVPVPDDRTATSTISNQQRFDYIESLKENQGDTSKKKHDSLWHQANAIATKQSGSHQSEPSFIQSKTSGGGDSVRPRSTYQHQQEQQQALLLPPPSLSFHGKSRKAMVSQAQQVGATKASDGWNGVPHHHENVGRATLSQEASLSDQATSGSQQFFNKRPATTQVGFMTDPNTQVGANERGEPVSARRL
jgi:hypothetical protein